MSFTDVDSSVRDGVNDRNTMSATHHDIYGMTIQAVTREDLEHSVIGELERNTGGWLRPANL
jgi:hypothetical protein